MLYTFHGQSGVSVETPEIKINHFIHGMSPERRKSREKGVRYIMILKNNYEYYQNKFNLFTDSYETGISYSDIEIPENTNFV